MSNLKDVFRDLNEINLRVQSRRISHKNLRKSSLCAKKTCCHGHFGVLLKPKFRQGCHRSRGLPNWSKWHSISIFTIPSFPSTFLFSTTFISYTRFGTVLSSHEWEHFYICFKLILLYNGGNKTRHSSELPALSCPGQGTCTSWFLDCRASDIHAHFTQNPHVLRTYTDYAGK